MPTTCAVYCRVSTEKQKEKNTIESQKRLLPAIAASKGWIVHKMYVDDGISGESLRHMHQLRQLLDDAELELFQYILIIDIDRFTRFSRESEKALIVDICLEHDIHIVTPDQIYNLSNRNDRLQFNIKGTVSLYEKETIRERCIRGIREKKLKGQWLGGIPPVPYKYNRNTKRLEIDEKKLPNLQEILKLAIGNPPRDIARKVNGYTPRMIRRILEPQRLLFYTGHMQVAETKVKGQWDAILTEKEMNRIVGSKKARNARGDKSTQAVHLLTGMGILRCGYCGKSLKAWHDKKIRKSGKLYDKLYYRCISIHDVNGPCKKSRMVLGIPLEQRIIKNIEATLSAPDNLELSFQAASQSEPDKLDQIENLRTRIKDEKKRKNRLIAAIEEDVIEFEDAKKRIRDINQTILYLQEEINKLEASQKTWDKEGIKSLTNLLNLPEAPQNKRMMLSTCLEKIKVYNASAYLIYTFPVSPEGRFEKRLKF